MNDILTLNGIIDWKTLTFQIDDVSLAGIGKLPSKILAIIADPGSNPTEAILVYALFAVLLLFIALVIVMLLHRKSRIVRIETDIEDRDFGISAGESDVEKVDSDVSIEAVTKKKILYEGDLAKIKDPLKAYFSIASFAVILVLMWLSTSAITQVNMVCTTCHGQDMHVSSRVETSHKDLSCVRCHEANGTLERLTTALPSRLAHVVVGTFKSDDVPGYSGFNETACLDCHKDDMQGTRVSRSQRLRISHRGILSDGYPCGQCHILSTETGELVIARNSMQKCLVCHDARNKRLECSTCHMNNSQYVKSARQVADTVLSKQLVPESRVTRSNFCYECHDPGPCDSCHGGVRMPHDNGYVSHHVEDTKSHGLSACLICHRKATCDGCHVPEELAGY